MGEMFNKFKVENILGSVLMIVVGVFLIIHPDDTLSIIAYGISAVMVIMGIIKIVGYLKGSKGDSTVNGLNEYSSPWNLIAGILLIIFAGLIATVLMNLISFVLGILIIGSGAIKLEQGITMNKNGGKGLFVIILGVVAIALGVICIAKPSFVNNIITQLIGAGLAYGGVTDILSTALVSKSK
ncbi:MAG: DUF308 domain-containing protein [Lachnospiraceae bacterium]|nr:DUF308 domain-containing protein [Lachnospiraceae bacterium]